MNASGEICVLANSHLREISSLYAQPEALSTLISENENTSENVRRAGQVIQGILQRAVLASGVRVVLNGAPAAMAACFLPRTLGCLADWSLRECGTMGSPTAELLLELVIITRGLPATYSLVEMIYCGWRSFQVKRSLARTFSENNRYRPLN